MLMRHAGGSEGTPVRDLLSKLKVPEKWIYRAEALKAKYEVSLTGVSKIIF